LCVDLKEKLLSAKDVGMEFRQIVAKWLEMAVFLQKSGQQCAQKFIVFDPLDLLLAAQRCTPNRGD